jgi:hypothetical protein
VRPRSINFGNWVFGTSGTASNPPKTVTIVNRGGTGEPITLDAPMLASDANGFYEITGGDCAAGLSLAPGSSCTWKLTFTPGAVGKSGGSVTFASNSNKGSAPIVALEGSGILGRLGHSPRSLNFGKVATSATSAAQVVTITNDNSVPLPITDVTVIGPDADDFSATSNCGAQVGATASCTISVTFSSTVKGARHATLEIVAQAIASPIRVAIKGTGD